MEKQEFEMLSKQLADNQEKFFTTVHMLLEGMKAVKEYVHSFQETIEAERKVFIADGSLMETHVAATKEVLVSLNAVVAAFAQTNVTINENSARLERLIDKVESYFGGSATGLDYDN